MKHPDLKRWEALHGPTLFVGAMVRISESCEYYEPEYDDRAYMVTYMFVDSGGLNIGVNDGGEDDRFNCATDGYYVKDLQPAETDNVEAHTSTERR